MIRILAKIFIKGAIDGPQEAGEPETKGDGDAGSAHQDRAAVRRAYGMLCSLVGIGLNILLFAGKYLAGRLSGSIAVTADAFNNLSDAGSSLMTLVGFKFAGMKPDKDHPFGHGRIEYVSGFCVSLAILLMGVELLKTSAEKIIHPEPVDTGLLTGGILLASVAVKLYMAFYNRSIGKKIDSSAMRATAADSLSDAVATTVVFLSMVIMRTAGVNVDGWCGALVALFILYAGYGAARDTLSPLLGQAPDPELIRQIRDITMAHKEIIGIHDLVVHDYGPGRIMISLHGEVPGDGDIFELHEVIDEVETELNEKLGCEAVIHMDPIAVNDELVKRTREQVAKLVWEIDPKFTMHDFRMVNGPARTKLIFDVVVPFGYGMTDAQVREKIETAVKETWGNYSAVVKVDHDFCE